MYRHIHKKQLIYLILNIDLFIKFIYLK